MHPGHLEMAMFATLEAAGRALALSARHAMDWPSTQEGCMAVGVHDDKITTILHTPLSSCKESSNSKSDPILKLPSGR